MLGGEGGLDLLVVDDPALGGVDEEHPARLQPALGDDLGRIDVDHADLRRHHDEVVVGDPVAARAQAVAVEHGADHRAVGERHAGRAVPRLHHRGVEAVERPLGGVHLVVVLPRLGDHHQHGVVDRPSAEVEQLEHLVEARRVRGARRADREGPLEPGHGGVVEHRLAGAHPVLVALHRVDLAVVGDVAVRVGERPRREGVRREAAVDEQQGALEALVGQVGEERRRAAASSASPCRRACATTATGSRWRSRDRARARCACGRRNALRSRSMPVLPAGSVISSCAKLGIAARAVAPRQSGSTGTSRQATTCRCSSATIVSMAAWAFSDARWSDRQEGHADGVGAGRGQLDPRLGADDLAQEAVGHLDQDPGAVAGVGLGARRPAVLEVGQGSESGAHQVVAAHTLDVGHERDPAGVVLESRVVETRGSRRCLHRPSHPRKSWSA